MTSHIAQQKAAYIQHGYTEDDEISGGFLGTTDKAYYVKWRVVPTTGKTVRLVIAMYTWCDAVDIDVGTFSSVALAERAGAKYVVAITDSANKFLKASEDCQTIIGGMGGAISRVSKELKSEAKKHGLVKKPVFE